MADSADGLLPPVDRARRLAIMATPDVGAFGVAALVVVLVARVAALAALAPDVALVAGLWAATRSGMAVTMAVVPYARAGGIAAGFAGRSAAPAAVTALAGAGRGGGRARRVGRTGHRARSRPAASSPSWPSPPGGSAGTPATCSAPPASWPRRWA